MLKHTMPLEQVSATQEQIREALPDDEQMLSVSRIFQALADPTRCKIMLILTRHELCVSDIAQILSVSISGISHNLKGLRNNRLVKTRREGNIIYYSVDDAHVEGLFEETFAHLDHLQQGLPGHLPVITHRA